MVIMMSVSMQVMSRIGPARFAAAASDSTGNTKKARRLLVAKFPTLVNCPDVAHHFNNTIKNISNLEFFQPVRPVRPITRRNTL